MWNGSIFQFWYWYQNVIVIGYKSYPWGWFLNFCITSARWNLNPTFVLQPQQQQPLSLPSVQPGGGSFMTLHHPPSRQQPPGSPFSGTNSSGSSRLAAAASSPASKHSAMASFRYALCDKLSLDQKSAQGLLLWCEANWLQKKTQL